MRNTIIAALFLALASTVHADEDYSKYAVWISGEAFSDQGVLLFRADQNVTSNVTGNVVLLGPSKDAVKVFLPLCAWTARGAVRIRARGVLFPVPGERAVCTPSVQFIIDEFETPTSPTALLLTRS